MALPVVEKEKFEKHGWLQLKNVFSSDEIQKMRHDIDKTLAESAGKESDLMSHEHLRHILVDDRICHIAKTLLDKPTYFGWSSFGGNTEQKPHALHHDAKGNKNDHNANSLKDPSKTGWPIIRMAIFLQDHKKHSGGLKIRDKSHHSFLLDKFSLKQVLKGRWSLKGLPFGRLIDIPSEPGDVIIFNMRTQHSGRFQRMKFAPQISFHPWVEHFIYRFFPKLIMPYEKKRYYFFTTYAEPSEEMENFIKNRLEHPANKTHWQYTQFSKPENVKLLEDKGIHVDTLATNLAWVAPLETDHIPQKHLTSL